MDIPNNLYASWKYYSLKDEKKINCLNSKSGILFEDNDVFVYYYCVQKDECFDSDKLIFMLVRLVVMFVDFQTT